MQIACAHKWEPMAILGSPAMMCCGCMTWRQISNREFRVRFGNKAFREARRQADEQLDLVAPPASRSGAD